MFHVEQDVQNQPFHVKQPVAKVLFRAYIPC